MPDMSVVALREEDGELVRIIPPILGRQAVAAPDEQGCAAAHVVRVETHQWVGIGFVDIPPVDDPALIRVEDPLLVHQPCHKSESQCVRRKRSTSLAGSNLARHPPLQSQACTAVPGVVSAPIRSRHVV